MEYHVCGFHKCASNWSRRLFRRIADDHGFNIWVNLTNPAPINQDVDRGAPDTLRIYQDLRRDKHDPYRSPGERTVLFVRDPKDVLVAQYWSWRNSHNRNTIEIQKTRKTLRRLSVRGGLVFLLDNDLLYSCQAIRTWHGDMGAEYLHTMRFERLLSDFAGEMAAALAHLGIEVSDDAVGELEQAYVFRRLAKRVPGDEDRSSHFRKGIAGDWINYFDADLAERFDSVYGEVCDQLGYERASGALDPSSGPV
jgi:hypothetical protein